jgi:tetratricopeptide (TPR) repeat protein
MVALGLTPLLLAATPPSSWDSYNEGVRAYGAGHFDEAFQRWQDLTLQPLPRGLRSPVWFQLGNAQFRLGEPHETTEPEQAAEWWRRSLEAYRTVLQRVPHHTDARHNLELVQKRLARLLHRLGREAFDAAEKQSGDPAIDLLRLSTTQLAEAVSFAPEEPAMRLDRDRAENALRQRLLERAARSEAKGDQEAARNTTWNDTEAEDQYRTALEDLGDAVRRPTEPTDAAQREAAGKPSPSETLAASASQAEGRVRKKLSDLLTRMGQREQQTGNENAKWDTASALEPYEAALELFTEAQQVKADNEAAQRGEREVRAALEQLHVRLGQKELEEGRERLARKSPDAAPPLQTALGDFEAAQGLNPDNPQARAGAEEARRLLPQALVLAGQRSMAAGERNEAQRAAEALSQYQEAETAFQQALELKPDQAAARQGLQEVEPRIARLRDRVAREAEQAARQAGQPNRPPPTLQDLLGQVSERQHERQGEWDRRRQRGQKQTSPPRTTLDW